MRGGRALCSPIREIIQQIRTDRCPLPSHPPKAKKTRVRPTWERLGASAFSTKEDAEKEIKGLEKGDSAFGEWTVASCDKKAKTFERSNQFTSEVQTVRYFLRRYSCNPTRCPTNNDFIQHNKIMNVGTNVAPSKIFHVKAGDRNYQQT